MSLTAAQHMGPLFFAVQEELQLDDADWQVISSYAAHWKLSMADALLDLCFLSETTLAKLLSKTHGCEYKSGQQLQADWETVHFEDFNDFLGACALPVSPHSLAVANPMDDLHGYLKPSWCERTVVVSERSSILQLLHAHMAKTRIEYES